MREFKPPQILPTTFPSRTSIFLGGSIDMGVAEKWQDNLVNIFKDTELYSKEEENEGALQVIFEDGVLYNETTLKEVRETLLKNLY